jgi:hypothetical protein
MLTTTFLVLAAATLGAISTPANLAPRAAVDNIVYITDTSKFCMIMPRDAATTIGASEHPGGMKTYCSPAGRYDNAQGETLV